MTTYDVIPTSAGVLEDAFSLAQAHGLAAWDAVIVAAAAQAGCRYLLSEDMHDGFSWRGVTVANPFAVSLPSPLAALLNATL
jgi:predicted nucleic acid-binding protein